MKRSARLLAGVVSPCAFSVAPTVSHPSSAGPPADSCWRYFRWHGSDTADASGALVGAEKPARGMGIERPDGCVVRRTNARNVLKTVEWRLEFPVAAIDEVRILDAKAVHERTAVDVSVPCDRAGFGGAEVGCTCADAEHLPRQGEGERWRLQIASWHSRLDLIARGPPTKTASRLSPNRGKPRASG